MKTIYLDNDFKCHLIDDGTMTAIETEFFDNKCDIFIEGCRFVPDGKSWVRSDGTVFNGLMISAYKPYVELDEAQRDYEQQLIIQLQNKNAEYEAALSEVGVNL